MEFQIGDYFYAKDIVERGENNWNLVRKKVALQGIDITEFGYFKNVDTWRYAVIRPTSRHERALHFSEQAGSNLLTVHQVLSLKKMPELKVFVDRVEDVKLLIDHLKSQGYSIRDSIHAESAIALKASSDGYITQINNYPSYLACKFDTLSYKTRLRLELYDMKVSDSYVEIEGVQVKRSALDAFLQSQKSAA